MAGEHVDEAQKTRQGLAYKRRVNDSPNNSHNYKSLGHDNEQPMQQVWRDGGPGILVRLDVRVGLREEVGQRDDANLVKF